MKKGFLQKKLAIDRFITFYFRFLQEINIISPMRKLIVFFSFWFSVTIVVAQNTERKLYSIAFYNLENLFDTIHDAGKNDYDFLPDGSYRWTAKKYEAKLHNLSDVLSSLSRNLVPEGPAVIGVAEVENHRVLTELSVSRLWLTISLFIMRDPTDVALTVHFCMIRNSLP